MSRGLSSALRAALAADHATVVHLLEVRLDSGTIRVTDAWHELNWNGHAWSALGLFLGFDSIEETMQTAANDTRVTLSAVDQTVIGAFLNEYWPNRGATIWLCALASDYSLVADPLKVLEGRLDLVGVSEDPDAGTGVVSVTVVNQWRDAERTAGRKTNDAIQQSFFLGDRGFQYAHQVTKPVIWGGKLAGIPKAPATHPYKFGRGPR